LLYTRWINFEKPHLEMYRKIYFTEHAHINETQTTNARIECI